MLLCLYDPEMFKHFIKNNRLLWDNRAKMGKKEKGTLRSKAYPFVYGQF